MALSVERKSCAEEYTVSAWARPGIAKVEHSANAAAISSKPASARERCIRALVAAMPVFVLWSENVAQRMGAFFRNDTSSYKNSNVSHVSKPIQNKPFSQFMLAGDYGWLMQGSFVKTGAATLVLRREER